MPATDWATWCAFDQIEPIGNDTERIILAEILCYAHNLWCDTDKAGKRHLQDILPFLGTRKATLSEVDAGAIRVHPRLAELRRRALES